MPWLRIKAIMGDFGFILVLLDLYLVEFVLNGMK